jgi:hypothetical protein
MFSRRIIATFVVLTVLALSVPTLPRARAAGGGTIAYGDVVQGTITNANYYEVWLFTGTRGDRIQISMQGDGKLDPYLGLIDGASEQVLIEDDDSGGNGNAYIEMTLPVTGEFVIVATRYGLDTGTSTGRYTLHLTGGTGTTNISSTTTTGPQELSPGVYYMGDLTLGEPVSGTISDDAYAQVYSVELQAGDKFAAVMYAAEGSALDPYLIFATQAGDVLAEDDDSGIQAEGNKFDALLQVTISQSGVYLLAATRSGIDTGKSSGDYVLYAGIPNETPVVHEEPVQQDLPPGMAYMGEIAVGAGTSGTITADSFFHIYEYAGTAGEQITITMVGTGGLDAYLGLLDPNDEVIAEDDDSAGGTDAQISIRLPESGVYLIIATRAGLDVGSTTGPYTLKIAAGTPPPPSGTGTVTGGFGGLPGRAIESEQGTFYLRGFGRSDNDAKCTALAVYSGVCASSTVPGRNETPALRQSRLRINR